MIRVRRTGDFEDGLEDLLKVEGQLREVVRQKIKWFVNNPEDTRLDNHPLRRSLKGKWAFSVTDDIRIVYEWVGRNRVRFLAIGPHHEVYKLL